jgi:bifunctional ADP-heptose synthase (sugar kinase/adenylyltransferase)
MVASCINSESFLGGSLIIAEHLSQFTNNVTLITSLGEKCSYSDYIKNKLSPCVRKQFVFHKEKSTLIKKRYVLKDGNNYSKLFETYSSNCPLLQREQTEQVISYIKQSSKEYDLVLVGDFDNGFTNTKIINCLSNLNNFLAINTQTNSGNRGYNVVTHYKRADFISLNEPEVRLAAHDRYSSLNGLVGDISEVMGCSNISITRGVKGALCFSKNEGIIKIPSLASESIDRVGAGDSFFAIASLAQAKGYSLLLSNFLGSIASAIDVQILCNKEPVKKASFCKFLTRLLK